ncbi:MAG: cobalt-precorrin 5A hydrolase [Lachnospiraceae bacterium]|nr:cobalt-precorrin 5A hydrolase [Lachnospiraceae bacterium]
MKLSIICFTQNGRQLATKIAKTLHEKTEEIDVSVSELERQNMSVGEWAKAQMEAKNALLFIGACGIAVRAIAPHLMDKLHDSPVLVMDEKGIYVIPILSGHMGGANALARYLAEAIGATPVITTATDLNNKFAVDLFAKRNHLFIVNKEGIAKVSAKALAGEVILFSIEQERFAKESHVPSGIQIVPYPPTHPVDVVVTSEERTFDAALLLKPKEYAIGMGCRKGKNASDIEQFILRKLDALQIASTQIFALSSISQKKKEPGILEWCQKRNIPFLTYTAETLQDVAGSFHTSSFVKDTVGVDNVCERAAIKACGNGGRLIAAKDAENGITIAIAKREWKVTFDEE